MLSFTFFIFSLFRGLTPNETSLLFAAVWLHTTVRRRNSLIQIFARLKKKGLVSKSISLQIFLANELAHFAYEHQYQMVLVSLKWQAFGTDYENPEACLHMDFLRNQELAVKKAREFVRNIMTHPSTHEEFLGKFLQHIEEKFNNELALSVQKEAINQQVEVSLFCAFDLNLNREQTKKICDLLQGLKSFEVLISIFKVSGTEEDSAVAATKNWLFDLAKSLTKESARQEHPLCDTTCECCKGMNERMHSRARSNAKTRITKFLENPTSSESVEFLEKYGETTLKSMCDRFMYE